MSHEKRLTETEIRERVTKIAEGYNEPQVESYHDFHDDMKAYSDWLKLLPFVPGFEGLRLDWDDGFIAGLTVDTRLHGRVALKEPYEDHPTRKPSLLPWYVTPAAIEETVQQILNLDVPQGSPLQIAGDAVHDLRCARDRLIHIGAIKAADRVRAAIRSAEGAVRHAGLAPYREARKAKKQKRTPAQKRAAARKKQQRKAAA
jgi:hypothetical protein